MTDLNGTRFAFDAGVESGTTKNDLNWPVLMLSALAVFGTLGNLLVCASICLDKQLQTVTNWFLFSLAIADCLVSSIVLPLAIIKDFYGRSFDLSTSPSN
jgi:hypothetical protein